MTKHDVIAFLTHLAEFIGPDARFVHQGMTSSDVLDTCLAVQLRRASDILIADVDALLAALEAPRLRAQADADHRPLARRPCRADDLRPEARVRLCRVFARPRAPRRGARGDFDRAISGAVGTFANIDPRVEAHVAAKLGLKVEPISTQVIPRDRHAAFFATLGVVASSVERLATEIRHLQRTEVLEAEEFFAEGQKGSSAMPHKRNPVLTENLTGLARMVRSAVIAGAGGRRALARARHLAFLGRADDRPRRDDHARFRAGAARRRRSTSSSSIPRTCGRISTSSAASSIRSACCWR